jgi:hypothetical protein
MSKLLALYIFSSIFFLSFYSGDSISKGISATVIPTATPTPNASDNLFRMELDRNKFILPCPPGWRCRQSYADSAPIVVTISNNGEDNNSLRYKYTTSGGRVIGEGAKVNWDFPNFQPGTYTITVVIADKSGNELQTITKTMTVEGYIDDGDKCLSCPELSVDAPTITTQAGEIMSFTARISAGYGQDITYNWTITNGKIIEGQGTPTIKVATNPKMTGKTVEATAKFHWDIICSKICNSTASASGLVMTKKRRKK